MFNVFSNRFGFGFLLLCTAGLIGCAGPLLRETLPSPADRLIAKDFAQIVSQVELYDPATTTFLVAKPIGPVDPFDTALREEFAIAGYNIDYLNFDSDADTPIISQVLKRSASADGEVRTYTLSFKGVSFRRGYNISSEGRITPATTMQAKGLDTDNLHQDDSIFGVEVITASNELESTQEVSLEGAQSEASLKGEGQNAIPVAGAPTRLSEHTALRGMQIVDETLLVFDENSLVLGDANKRSVVNVVSNYKSDSDVFSLLGCVRTEDVDWTEEASKLIGDRTERVRSELRYAGIPNDQIKIENCARSQEIDAPKLPSNGVLLLLNRGES